MKKYKQAGNAILHIGCAECKRSEKDWDGCAHMVCPNRKLITAQPSDGYDVVSDLRILVGSVKDSRYRE